MMIIIAVRVTLPGMAAQTTQHAPAGFKPGGGRIIPDPPNVTALAAGAAAARAAAAKTHTTPPNYQPWLGAVDDAQLRVKTELNAASQILAAAITRAGAVLDSANTVAQGQAQQLEATAIAAYTRYMEAAAAVTSRIMGPAYQAYDAAIVQAVTDYDAAVAHAAATWQRTAQAADAAKAAAKAAGLPVKTG